MNQTSHLLATLKQYLKAKGITYKVLAREMGLSETSIKRLFSQETFSLRRLEELCRVVDLEIYDLVLMAKKRGHEKDRKLTLEQERALLDNERMTYFFYFLVNGWSVEEVIDNYQFTRKEAKRYLIILDKLELIEWYAEYRFRPLVSSNIFWNKGGPLWQAFKNVFSEDFLDHPFDLPNERLALCPAVMTADSYRIISRKVDSLVAQINELAELDSALPLKNRFSVGLFIGFRPWFYSGMAKIRRKH